jgi:ABC-2 type transport system permease protein
VIRGEIRKLTTIRGPWLLLAAGPLLVIAGVTGLVQSGGNLAEATVQSSALAHIGLAALFPLVAGILAVAGEYRHRTITDTYLGDPVRARVVTAKLAVYAVLGAAAGLVSALAGLGATAAWCAIKGVTFRLSAESTWLTAGGGVAVNVAFAVIGVGLGALIRNVIVAIAAALAWIALIEGIAAQLLGSSLARWLPFSASQALGREKMTSTVSLLPQWGGALVLLGYAAAAIAAATLTTLGRDVT